MSATSWGDCPRCKREAQESVDRAKAAARDAYGKVPLTEYEQLQAEANRPLDLQAETLREDYELGINNVGVFYVSYAASCANCPFQHRFIFTEPTLENAERSEMTGSTT